MKVEEITSEMCLEVSKIVSIDGITREQVVQLSDIPEVARVVRDLRVRDHKLESLPQWARDAGVTVAEWDVVVEEIQLEKKRRSDKQRELDRLAAEYREKCAAIHEHYDSKRPKRDPKTDRLVKAATATVSDLPLNVRARLNLNLVHKTPDQRSELIADTLAAYRASCVRRA